MDKNVSHLLFTFIFIVSYCAYASDNSQELPGFYQQPVVEKSQVYNNPVVINNALSNQSYHFDSAVFKQKVSFNEVNSHSLSFNWANFYAPLLIYRLTVNENGNFYYTIFHDKVDFSKLLCNSNCIFNNDIFNQVKISNSSFKGLLSFQHSLFNKEIKIENSSFADRVDFSQITAKSNIRFERNFFNKELIFAGSKVDGVISFNETVPPLYLDFSEMELKQHIDLRGMDLNARHSTVQINLLKTNVNKIKFNYNNFKLYFPPDTPIDLIQNTYSSLLKKFKTEEDITSHKLLLAEYSEYINHYRKDYIKNLISKYWWNYGTNPEWIFFWMGTFILFYTIINAIFYEKITKYYLNLPFLRDTAPVTIRHHPIIHFIYFLPRAFLFTMIMFSGSQFNLRVTIKAFKTNNVLVNIYFVIIIFSGLVCLYFLLKYILAQLG